MLWVKRTRFFWKIRHDKKRMPRQQEPIITKNRRLSNSTLVQGRAQATSLRQKRPNLDKRCWPRHSRTTALFEVESNKLPSVSRRAPRVNIRERARPIMVEGEGMQSYSEKENQEKQKQEGKRAFDVKIRS